MEARRALAIGRLVARTVWRLPFFARLLVAVLRSHPAQQLVPPALAAGPPVFLVASTIAPGNRPLSYHGVRSVFTPEERFEQTLDTIASIRSRLPDAVIVIVENSRLRPEYATQLSKRVDWLVEFDTDPVSSVLRDGPFKGAAEVLKLLRVIDALPMSGPGLLFKLSGRYVLTSEFRYDQFPGTGFGLHESGGVPSTVLYSVAPDAREGFVRQLRRALRLTLLGLGVEEVLFAGVDKSHLHYVNPLGIEGRVAVTGDLVRY